MRRLFHVIIVHCHRYPFTFRLKLGTSDSSRQNNPRVRAEVTDSKRHNVLGGYPVPFARLTFIRPLTRVQIATVQVVSPAEA
jgi:hypothetical protein